MHLIYLILSRSSHIAAMCMVFPFHFQFSCWLKCIMYDCVNVCRGMYNGIVHLVCSICKCFNFFSLSLLCVSHMKTRVMMIHIAISPKLFINVAVNPLYFVIIDSLWCDSGCRWCSLYSQLICRLESWICYGLDFVPIVLNVILRLHGNALAKVFSSPCRLTPNYINMCRCYMQPMLTSII